MCGIPGSSVQWPTFSPREAKKDFMEKVNMNWDSKNQQRLPRQKRKEKVFQLVEKYFAGVSLPAYGLLGKKQDFQEKLKLAVPQKKEKN